jgi:ubiquinone/menaquinone biosynthesis C-methylase UbiE
MSSPFIDRTYLEYQYDNSEKLRIRGETHRLYTVGEDDFAGTELRHLAPEPGLSVFDVGCGPGRVASELVERGMRYLGLDRSFGLVSEARTAAGGAYVQGDALALPVADASFDRVLALGVLYHIGRWQDVLREMRRVARPGGRIVVSTHSTHAMRRIYDVHREAALELGYTPLPQGGPALHLEDLPEVQAILPTVQCHVQESALVFAEAEPALRFYATNRIDMVEGWQTDTSHRARLLPLMREKIEAIIAIEGAFRVPKDFGYFVAEV